MSWSSKLIEPEEEVLGPSDYIWWVRSTADNLELSWYLKGGEEQSCKAELLNCRIWCYLLVDSVRTELNCSTPSWHLRTACYCEKTFTHWNGSKTPTDKVLVSWAYVLWKFSTKKSKIPKNLGKRFKHKDVSLVISIWEMLNIVCHQGNTN